MDGTDGGPVHGVRVLTARVPCRGEEAYNDDAETRGRMCKYACVVTGINCGSSVTIKEHKI